MWLQTTTVLGGLMKRKAVYGGVEAGGTKFVCMLGTNPGDIIDERVIPTESPEKTLAAAAEFFLEPRPQVHLTAVGIASFGPIDLDQSSLAYGHITTTPKLAWRNINIVGMLKQALKVDIGFDTDVNGAALGEVTWGAGRGADPLLYVTVGTGVGGGAVVGGRPLHGMLHPEMGHLPVRVHPDDSFQGTCEFHSWCLEGMVCGPALAKRLDHSPELAKSSGFVWEFEAEYLAQGLLAMAYVLSPQRIILGGGVMNRPGLRERVRERIVDLNNRYVSVPALNADIREYVVAPGLGTRSGVLGAIEIARRTHEHTAASRPSQS
jgi:fructokinase